MTEPSNLPAPLHTTYRFLNEDVRVVLVDGDPWWVLTDVAKILGFRDASNAARVLRAGQTRYSDLSTNAGSRNVAVCNESGLYRLIMRATAPVAEPFQDWVTSEVLPRIRRTGSYAMAPALPQTYAEALRALLGAVEENERQAAALLAAEEAAAALAAPAAEYGVWVDTGTTLDVGAAAKRLAQHGVPIGRNRLYALLRDKGWVFQASTEPTQPGVDGGYVQVEAGKPVTIKVGGVDVVKPGTVRTRITPKGLEALSAHFGITPPAC
jgi:anti-repressor protein